ncbi:carboxylesterase family protein [Poritiphilus flavus]|uniref:Prolyl oligopeptidase family serine peptidase n=1 Tax=Poritiphilus flavus TaxID=2697053 RepID=A0A6L9EC36_9FLAO|nr:PHB depolymerase family esterase [Poritiphilus flavus]NAS12314.1 prolyl oligopeptidase family serine peptidase [Poritiphilus flavus]
MIRGLSIILVLLFIESCASQPKSQLLADEEETVVIEKLQYYLYFPPDYETKKEEQFPILLFLHGGGESGDSLGALKSNGPPKLIAEGKQFPFLILAPQNPHPKKWWNTRAVMQLLDTIVQSNRVDKKRIYLTGLSRGGGAAWELAVQYPERFAAMAVVCGMTPVPYASWIDKDMPIWVFHGTEDKSIPFSESQNMVDKLQQMGYDVKFTKYEGVGHNSWVQAYNTEGLYDWFIAQKRKD